MARETPGHPLGSGAERQLWPCFAVEFDTADSGGILWTKAYSAPGGARQA